MADAISWDISGAWGFDPPGPAVQTLFNFNLSMDKQLHAH